ncbi:MAG: lytic transglycosylase domain-containing protein [Sphingomonadales bacterium]
MALICGLAGIGQAALAGAAELPAPAASPAQPAPMLKPLSGADAQRYREIFVLQEQGAWAKADRVIAALNDDVLIGHVLFQRYMHPTRYRSSYQELRRWLEHHADHPGATRVYALALKRRGNAAWPRRPEAVPIKVTRGHAAPPPYRMTSAVVKFRRHFMRHVARREYREADGDFARAIERGIFSADEIGRYGGYLAEKMLARGQDAAALATAGRSATHARGHRYKPDWVAGLAAWRLQDYGLAQRHFEHVALAQDAPDSERAAGAWWAARAAFLNRDTAVALQWLASAARHETSFYGLIAERQLGIERPRDWSEPILTQADWRMLSATPGVKRAAALAQIGEFGLADEELRNAWRRAEDAQYRPFLALAAALGLPGSQFRIALERPAGQALPLTALYPMPGWRPEGGFRLDQALIFALVRQESAFRVRAKSHAGARGLMQLMPRTASYITGDRRLVRDREQRLYDPAFNMALGQDYLEYLFAHDATYGNLFMVLAAYNGGPGNVARWDRNVDFKGDPLLFMETIPLTETRTYVERVMTNYWLYRMRLGQPTPSLDAVAAGAWPVYEPADPPAAPQLAEAGR